MLCNFWGFFLTLHNQKFYLMPTIKIYNRTTKKEGSVKIRFRISDGRETQLYHKSEIVADLSDLSKFEPDGSPKKRSNYNRELHEQLRNRISLIADVYEECLRVGMPLSNETFEEELDRAIHPEKYQTGDQSEEVPTFLEGFKRYIEEGPFSDTRKRAYKVTSRILSRFLIINDLSHITSSEVTPAILSAFRDFIEEEWRFARMPKYRALYKDVKPTNIPTERRVQNTIATKLKMLRAYFSTLEDLEIIEKNPFRKLGKETRKRYLKEQYADPVALTLDEVRTIMEADIPISIREARDAFLLQCALGCRISDFSSLSLSNLSISPDGIPYIHYVPKKTRAEANSIKEVKTPLVRFAFDIVRRTSLNIPILRNVSGKSGYNYQIKKLLEYCRISREVGIWDEGKKEMDYIPLYQMASTKLGRKTNVTLLSRVQVDSTIAGLHAKGSEAVNHYYARTMRDLFLLMSKAFGEEPYQVDERLNLIEEE